MPGVFLIDPTFSVAVSWRAGGLTLASEVASRSNDRAARSGRSVWVLSAAAAHFFGRSDLVGRRNGHRKTGHLPECGRSVAVALITAVLVR
jgi:hypothetical protein